MARFLFWNLKNLQRSEQVAQLVCELGIDFLVLAEASTTVPSLLSELNRKEVRFHYHRGFTPKEYTHLYSTLPSTYVESVRDSGRLSVRRVAPPIGADFLIVTAHMASKMYQNRESQAQLCTEYSRIIEEEECRSGHSRTLFVGDFNMNPFEDGMVSGFGFHAVSTRHRASEGRRLISGIESRKHFYNPMWRFLGERHGQPPGTFHYSASSPIELFWHTFDQVLVRPDLLDAFHEDSLQIITTIGNTTLLTEHGVPSSTIGSDHLPVMFELTFERLQNG